MAGGACRHLWRPRRDRRRLRRRYAGNVTSDGHSQLPASGGDVVLKRIDVSLALVLAGNLPDRPEPALRKFKERRPGAEAWVIREATNVWTLVLLQTHRCGGVAGAERETAALQDDQRIQTLLTLGPPRPIDDVAEDGHCRLPIQRDNAANCALLIAGGPGPNS